jgi:hypothetical protein
MTGGTIKDNESGNDGGGVYIYGPNSKASILNGRIGVSGGGNKAKYGAGVYAGANGSLELGTDGASHLYPYIQYNVSSNTGGGIMINGSGAAATFYHGTVSNNNGADMGGGILIVAGKLDMRGGTVTGNTAATGPGIMVQSHNTGLSELTMSGLARVLVPSNPIYLDSANGTRKITLGTFTGDVSGGIAKVELASGYSAGDQILDGDLTYYGKFEIIAPPAFTIDSTGKLQ